MGPTAYRLMDLVLVAAFGCNPVGPLVADSVRSSACPKAVIQGSATKCNGSFPPLEPTDTSGQFRPLAVCADLSFEGPLRFDTCPSGYANFVGLNGRSPFRD
jgi:hypothetical protein